MNAWLRRARPLFIMIAGVIAVASCDQNLESGAACPALCPGEAAAVRDTTFFAVAVDTSVPGFPPIGTEPRLLIAVLGDTFDSRGVIRFDSLATHYFAGGDSAIRSVDSARVTLRLAAFDTLDADSVTFEAYDVDAAGDDTAAATLVPAFVPSNFLGAKTIVFADSATKKDSTIVIPIDTAKLIAKITGDSTNGPPRLRVGIRLVSDSAAQAQIFTTNSSTVLGAVLSYLPAAGTTATRVNLFPLSKTPVTDAQLRADLSDFQIVAIAPPPPAADVIRVGSTPGWRAYIRFSIPPVIMDSSSVIRATLVLHQHPNPALPEAGDSMYVMPFAMTASSVVDDFSRLLTFLSSSGDSVLMVPKDSQTVTMQIINFVRPWRGSDSLRTPRAIALSASLVDVRAGAIEFYSNEAPDSLRPTLRLSYITQPHGGLP